MNKLHLRQSSRTAREQLRNCSVTVYGAVDLAHASVEILKLKNMPEEAVSRPEQLANSLRAIVCQLFARSLLQTLFVSAHENFGAPRQLQQNVIVANEVHR